MLLSNILSLCALCACALPYQPDDDDSVVKREGSVYAYVFHVVPEKRGEISAIYITSAIARYPCDSEDHLGLYYTSAEVSIVGCYAICAGE